MTQIRDYAARDAEAVRAATVSAFGRPDEADLVEALRDEDAALVECVAEQDGDVFGHIMFSRLVAGDGPPLAALAPMAVTPDRQRAGVGGLLIRMGLERCRTLGLGGVVVLGHPDYYPRFGFTAAAAQTLRAPFSGPAFMALAFEPGALDARTIRYAAAFGLEGKSR